MIELAHADCYGFDVHDEPTKIVPDWQTVDLLINVDHYDEADDGVAVDGVGDRVAVDEADDEAVVGEHGGDEDGDYVVFVGPNKAPLN